MQARLPRINLVRLQVNQLSRSHHYQLQQVRCFSQQFETLAERAKSAFPKGGASTDPGSQFNSIYKTEQEANSTILKMHNVLRLIEERGFANDAEKAKITKLQKDLEELKEEFQNIVFWEQQDGFKGMDELSDEEWIKQEKLRELKMKKLATVAKSKFYMLKVSYASIVDQVSDEDVNNAEMTEEKATDLNIRFESQEPGAVNVLEEAENLESAEQKELRKQVYEKDAKHKEQVDKYTDHLIKALDSVKEIDEAYHESGKA